MNQCLFLSRLCHLDYLKADGHQDSGVGDNFRRCHRSRLATNVKHEQHPHINKLLINISLSITSANLTKKAICTWFAYKK